MQPGYSAGLPQPNGPAHSQSRKKVSDLFDRPVSACGGPAYRSQRSHPVQRALGLHGFFPRAANRIGRCVGAVERAANPVELGIVSIASHHDR